jgi:hypothetical protein
MEDQIDCLNLMVQHLLKYTTMIPKMTFILQYLYDVDLLDEDSIIKWHEELEDAAGSLKDIKLEVMPS